VAGFVSILIERTNGIIDRIGSLNTIDELVGLRHELFMLALGLLGAALFTFAREAWMGLNNLHH
jgi:hypothetical protein